MDQSGGRRGAHSGMRVSLVDLSTLLVLGGVVLVVFLDEPHVLPRARPTLNLAPGMLPLYALYSFLRMLAAFVVSLGFALVTGYWAATSSRARRLILPPLDILQAVPILGFFPAAVFFFIGLFHGSPVGVEAAAVFLRLPLDELLPLLAAAKLLSWASVTTGDHDLTEEGERVARADGRPRQQLLRDRVRRLPLIAAVLRALDRGDPVSRDTIGAPLRARFGAAAAERQIDIAVDGGRHAELFDYDADERVFHAVRPASS